MQQNKEVSCPPLVIQPDIEADTVFSVNIHSKEFYTKVIFTDLHLAVKNCSAFILSIRYFPHILILLEQFLLVSLSFPEYISNTQETSAKGSSERQEVKKKR